MNKDAALQRLTSLEAEAAQLRKILEVKSSILPNEAPNNYFRFDGSYGNLIVAKGTGQVQGHNHFTSADDAAAWINVFNVALALRRQPGSAPVDLNGAPQWVITLETDGRVRIVAYSSVKTTCGQLSPTFAEYQDALSAIDTLGAERIEAALKTLSSFGK